MPQCMAVFAEGKIAEHFEESMLTAGIADVFEVIVFAARAHALLGRRGADVVAHFKTLENFLELVHAGVGEEQRRIVGRTSEPLRTNAVAASVEEIEEALTDIVSGYRGAFEQWIP
jgi:hypothetical protein